MLPGMTSLRPVLRSRALNDGRVRGTEVLLTTAAVRALAGCSPTQQRNGAAIAVSAGGTDATIQLVTLPDSTRCATLIGSYKAAMSCDWEHEARFDR